MKKKPTVRLAQERKALSRLQLIKLNRGLGRLRRSNRFYKAKLENTKLPLASTEDIVALPFTTKDELVRNQEEHPPFGTNLTSPLARYTRVHATSGTTGRKLKWLDTDRTWAWFVRCWQEVYLAAGLDRDDVVFAAFGFGPFIGFWGGFEAAQALGAMVVAGGAQSSLQRIDWIRDSRATVLLHPHLRASIGRGRPGKRGRPFLRLYQDDDTRRRAWCQHPHHPTPDRRGLGRPCSRPRGLHRGWRLGV